MSDREERTPEQVREVLRELAQEDATLSRRSLRVFSDLDDAEYRAFCAVWPSLPRERRVAVARELRTLAEDTVELDFRQLFLGCLHDQEPAVRSTAVDGLWEDERPATLRRLLNLLQTDPAREVRVATLLNLSRFAYQAEMGELYATDADALCQTLLDIAGDLTQPIEVRRRAVEALGYFAEISEAQAEIGRAYDSANVPLRESALIAMGRSMRAEWFPLIERELRSPSPVLRFAAAQAVGELGEDGQQLLSSLLALVDDEDIEVTLSAVWALGEIGGPHSERVLQRLTRSKNEAVRQAASDALATLHLSDI